MKRIFLIFFSIITNLFADDFHSVQNFFGERATGLGGAFSGISDDASGTYYNPGGISFIQDNHYSINVSSYKVSKQKFSDLFGPGQNYNRSSRTYLPNFLGFVRKFGKWTFGLTMVNSINESFDQTNRILLPLYRRNLSQIEISYNREHFQIMAGPSVGYLLSSNLSIGLTGYYLYDTNKLTSTQNENQYNSNITVVQELERRRTSGFVPVLGIQYMLLEKLTLGLSLRKTYVTGGTISLMRNITGATQFGTPSSNIAQGSASLFAISSGGLPVLAGGLPYQIPETYEVRGGWAFFPTKKITLAMDAIYTSGYKFYQTRSEWNMQNNQITYKDPFLNSLAREQTLNFAGGVEFYITENIVIRFGRFTNLSNNKNISWLEAALISSSRNFLGPGGTPRIGNLNLEIPTYREIHANLHGYSFGIGFETASTTLSFSVSHQAGKGIGIVDQYQLPARAVIQDTTFYISGGSKY